jgi:hypothetical protein
MLFTYAACHEDFVWDIRSEPGVVEAFEKAYQDNDLIVSFDAINYGFANRTHLPKNVPWPHQDQDPSKPGFRCLQGLVNLHNAGPNDGGLIVSKGSHLLSEQFHEDMKDEERIPAWTPEWFGYTDNGMKWLEEHGCAWYKVEADAGDLIVWDSRTAHYNVPTSSDVDRLAIYTCYMPVSEATQEELLRKKDAFNNRLGTTHWPNARNVGWNEAKRNGQLDTIQRNRPWKEPQLSERAFKLTGIPYIKTEA